jgi:transposase
MGAEGYSVVEMAAEIGVNRSTLEKEWPEANPEFSQAFTQSRQLSQAWWERQGRMNLLIPQGGGTFQASVWSRSMAARFPADWREKSVTELTGANGGPVQIVADAHDEKL